MATLGERVSGRDMELDANEEEWELGGNSTQDLFLQFMFINP